MKLTNTELHRLAADTGFNVDPLTKMIRLLEMIEAIRSHPFLKSKVALVTGLFSGSTNWCLNAGI